MPKVNNEAVMAAVRELRHRLGQNQEEFGTQIDKRLSTIYRYETVYSPTGQSLVKLVKLAREHRHMDLAAIFQKALTEQFGLGEQFWDPKEKG